MPGLAKDALDWMTQRGQNEPPAAARSGADDPPVEWADRRVTAAVIGLSVAGVLAPIAVAWAAGANALLWQPLAASGLLALLVLAPAAVAVATALAGFRRIASLAAQTASEAEQAVLRVLVATLLFVHALALTAFDTPAADCVPVAAVGVIAAWILLLSVILWPAAPPPRRYGAIAFDIAILSAFLHFGGNAVAGWYPLYLVAIFYAGLRFGLGALFVSGGLSILGFLAVVLTTEADRQHPSLAAGLMLAIVVLPAFLVGAIRARAAAAEVEADRQRALLLIADTLRDPGATARLNRAASSPIGDILDYAAIEAGTFAPPVETFDLRALVRESLAPVRAKAAENGSVLRWRIDPRLPYRLRGHAQALARILASLADQAAARAATARLTFDAADADPHRLNLRIRVDGLGVRRDPGLPPDEGPLALRLVQRLVAMVGGTLAMDHAAGQRFRLTLRLPLAVEGGAPGPVLDLGRRPVVIATADDDLARELAEPLAVWNAEPRWPGDIDAALADLAGLGDTERPIVIADGRDRLLSALSLAHQAARGGAEAPFILLIADQAQIASLLEVEEGELDGFIPAPVTERLLANALHALPLRRERPAPRAAPRAEPQTEKAPAPTPPPSPPPYRPAPSPRPAPRPDTGGREAGGREPLAAATAASERVTPIAAHPKYLPETAAAVDARVIEGLRALGGGSGFLREVIESFCADAGQMLEAIQHAAAAADAARFARAVMTLHRAARQLGGVRLCELATSLQRVTASDLRQHGAAHVQRLAAEIERLAVALTEFLPATESGGG